MDWLTPSLVSAAISMAMLVAAYAYVYARRRQPEMGLWALGWTAYLGRYFSMLAGLFLPLSALWNYISLALLGLSAFLLWAGTRHFVGRPFPRRAYAWGVLPVVWAGVVFLRLEERLWLLIPIYLFASAADLFTAACLYRYSRSGEGLRGAKGAALGYGLWGVLELAYAFVYTMLLPLPGVLSLGLLLANGLALALAVSLIALSMREMEQRAWQQAQQLESLLARVEALAQASARMVTELDLEKTLAGVVQAGLEALRADRAAVYLYDEAHDRVDVGYAYGLSPQYVQYIQDQFHDVPGYRILQTLAPMWVRDAQSDPEARALWEMARREGFHSYAVLPLQHADRLIGAMVYYYDGIRTFTEGDQQLCQALANQAAVAIENARLHGEAERRLREMTALHKTALDITAQLEMPRLLNAIIARASDLLGATGGLVHLYDPAKGKLVAVTSHNLDKDYTGLTLELGEGVAGKVFQTGEPLIIDDHRTWAGKSPQVTDAAARAMLAVPLKWQERVIGVLDIMDNVRVGAFDEQDLQVLVPFANQAAISIGNARLFEEARRRARQLEALSEIGRAIGSILDLDAVLRLILEQLEQVIPYDAVSLWLREEKVMRIRAVRGFGASEAHLGLTVTLQDDALSQEMVSTRQPLILADAQRDERFRGLAGTEWVRSWLGVPLLSKGKVIGLLTINKREPGLYTAEMAELALAFGQQAAIAIENARLYAAEQQRRREAETLHRAAQALATTLDLHQVFERILSELQQVVPCDSASVQLLRDGHLEIIGGHGFPNLDELLGITFDLSKEDNPNREVIRRRASLIVEDAPAVYSRFREEPHAAAGIRAWLGVPLLFGDRLIGMLALDKREPGFYTSEHARLAEAFAAQAAVAIENARLYEEAQRRADELTRLHKAAVAVSSSLELSEVLGTLAKQVGCALDTSSAYICNLDEETGQSTVLAEWISPEATNHESDLGATYDLHRYPTTLRALQEKRPLVARATDPDLDPADRQSAERYGWKSYLIVPLVIRDRVIGYVELWETRREREFTEAEVRLCQTLAADAAAAIEHARLYEEARRYVEELTVLHTIDVAITSSLNLDEVLQRVYEQVSTVMDIAAFHIGVYDEKKDELHLPIIVDQGERLPPLALKVEEKSSLSGWVVRTRQPLWIEDMEKEQDTLPVKGIALGVPTRSLMVLPLITRDKVVGVISAQSYEPYVFDEGHRRLFSGIASQVAIAVENARLFEETSRRLAETRLLQEVMQAAASTLDFDEVLTRTIETLHRTLGIEYLVFALPDERGTGLMLHPSQIGYAPVAPDLRLPLDGSVVGRVYQSGEPQIIPDVHEVQYYFEGAPEIRSELAVPVKVAGRVIAVLNAESPHLGAFSEDDLRLFSAVAAQLGVVLENARLYEETKRRLAEARLIQEVMLAAASTLDFDLVLERTIKALHRALGIDRLGFLLPDEGESRLVPHPSLVGFTESAFRIPVEGSLVGQAYRTGQPVLVRDLTQEPAYPEWAPEVGSALAVPVRVGDRVIAVLHAESPQVGAFGEDELRLFTTIGGQLGVTLENATKTAELSQAYDELQEINRLRAELVQNVGHELRTPLSLIQGYVELLLEGALGRILDSQRAALQIIRERTATLTRLIHNLMMLQAVPRAALALAPVSVVEVVQHALAEFRRSAEKAGIAFQEELPAELPPVLGDRERLELVFGHLVDNAIKFSPGGGTVTIRAWADQKMVYVSIADEGIGIPSEHLSRIFERFYQVDGTTRRRFGGMGVGLALVWEIVEAHGGTVEVESEPGEGSTFTVALPQANR